MSSQLPREILEKAVTLRNSVRKIFIALYTNGKPSTSTEIAQVVGQARAHVNMRLQQLVDMGLAKVELKGRTKYFEATK
ncbi:winged helix-turn-helix transcriptional regulator [Candidatus Bathyarchaeota archaeon]|nr:winged helix-turn-helix transcriptional regulator [Candidatus Bathyarchaeota archaeon]